MPKIDVPKPAPGSFNRHRPVSDLLRWQMRHFHEVEARLPYEHQTGISHHTIKTEGEAASYIRNITAKLAAGVHLREQINVPTPAPGSMNKNRPMSQLLRNQVSHFREIERQWPPEKQTGVDVSHLRTEAEAADYIRKMTAQLHPQGAPRKRK